MSSTMRRHDAENLGELTTRRRKELAAAQEEIAARAGIDGSYLSRIENGHQVPAIAKCLSLATALRLPLSDVIAARKVTVDAWDAAKLVAAATRLRRTA